MSDVAAFVISKIEGGMPSADGSHLLLKVLQPDGPEAFLALPSDQLIPLINAAALGRMQTRKIQGINDNVRDPLPTTWWDLATNTQDGSVVLSLTFGVGGRLDFFLPDPMPQSMLESLQVVTGQSSPPPPGTRTN